MSNTSLSLLARIRDPADVDSWKAFVSIYTPLMRRWLRAYDVQEADVDDLLQEVLSTAARELSNFQHNERPGAFRSWLRKVLVNRLRHFWRGRQQPTIAAGGSSVWERLQQLEDDASQASSDWEVEHDRELLARLLELVRPTFLPKTWEAFRRQMFGQQRADQVAAELEISLSSVYVARSRVLAALRREAAGLIDTAEGAD
jgi:RNA polymerase sigma-70 factor (ECF subfamily)